MKKLFLAAAAFAALSAPALAADLPGRGAPGPIGVPVYSFQWTGFFFGGQIGYGWGGNRFTEVGVVGANARTNMNGLLGGLHLGANWQTGNVVFGIEGDIELSGYKGSSVVAAPFTVMTGHRADVDWQGSARARLGYAFDRAMVYVTGGLAVGNIDTTYLVPAATATSTTRVGYAVGAGLEYAFTQNWTARGEYRYTDFGRYTDLIAGVNYSNRVHQHGVRFGASYKW
jgi:outer membrane immunogenic protein